MILDLIKKLGFTVLDADIYEYIGLWKEWYKGQNKFHDYLQYNGKRQVKRTRATLNMAKKLCEDWANLLLNEKAEIVVENESTSAQLRNILVANNFRVQSNRLTELAFALGTGAFVEYKNGDNVIIDYIRADMIFPISCENGMITECIFGSEKIIDGKKCIYLNLHLLKNGKYTITNRLFDADTNLEMPLPKDVKAEYSTGREKPFFQIIKPNICNNIQLSNCMGISVYSNCIDVLQGIDLIYDSYLNEFKLGKKRILIPMGMVDFIEDGTGQRKPIFDYNDTEFYAVPKNEEITGLKEIDMHIRAAEHTEGLQQNLNLLSDKAGLGTDRYKYDNQGLKTATEVISEKSELYQNMCKHQILLRSALCDLAKSVLYLAGNTSVENAEIKVDFDDSIIHDTESEKKSDLQLVSSGIMPIWEFRVKWFNETEEQAKKMTATDLDRNDDL